jgi:hypothetical protein
MLVFYLHATHGLGSDLAVPVDERIEGLPLSDADSVRARAPMKETVGIGQ